MPTTHEIFEEFKVPASSRRVAQVVLAAGDFGRPMMVTPGTPPDRVKLLRDAFVKTLNDPDVLAEAKKARMDVEPTIRRRAGIAGQRNLRCSAGGYRTREENIGQLSGNSDVRPVYCFIAAPRVVDIALPGTA